MTIVEQALYFAVAGYWILYLVRFVVSAARMFSREWHPRGFAAGGLELVYTVTDPPLILLRKLIKPFKIGNMIWDFSFFIVLLGLFAARTVMRAEHVVGQM